MYVRLKFEAIEIKIQTKPRKKLNHIDVRKINKEVMEGEIL